MKFYFLTLWLIGFSIFNAHAFAQMIELKSKTDEKPPVIVIKSPYDYERNISLKVNSGEYKDDREALIALVSKMDIRTPSGLRVLNNLAVNKEHNVVIGYCGGTSEIVKATKLTHGVQLITSFKQITGQFVAPPKSKVAVTNTLGQKLCYDYESVQTAMPKMSFALLLDKSGSMSDEIQNVKVAANAFLSALPVSAQCSVLSFDTNWNSHGAENQNCRLGKFDFSALQGGGQTDIYGVLKERYQSFQHPSFKDHQKAVIVITDGYTMSNAGKDELINLKDDVLTFVYFIGGSKRDDLEGIADHFLSKADDVKSSLSQYFKSLSTAFTSQRVITVKPCPASALGAL